MKYLLPILFINLLFIFSCGTEVDNVGSQSQSVNALEVFDYYDDVPQGSHVRDNSLMGDNKKAALGRILFYDKKLSLNNNVSCATCHKQRFGFGEDQSVSTGLFGESSQRNSSALMYANYRGRFFWEGRSSRLREAVLEPILEHSEMAMPNIEALEAKLSEVDYYPELFNEAFGNDVISSFSIGKALGSFIASMYLFDSKYDQGLNVEFINFTQEEKKGLELFNNKAQCRSCHFGYNFDSYYQNANIGLALNYEDEGSGSGSFKVPTLRNIGITSPYMHDGRFKTLDEVIEHYNSGIKKHENLSWHLIDDNDVKKLNLSEQEKSDLKAFLLTLTDESIAYDPRFSNPFK